MLSCNDYRRAYQDLYSAMRSYLWGVDVFEILANLEVSVYDAFVDVETVDRCFSKLERAIKALDVDKDDEDVAEALKNFRELLDDKESQQYLPIYKVNEVLPESDEDVVEDVIQEEFEEEPEEDDYQEEYSSIEEQ